MKNIIVLTVKLIFLLIFNAKNVFDFLIILGISNIT
jgi:hypothetical protein